jgi:hypothetical protein
VATTWPMPPVFLARARTYAREGRGVLARSD